MFHLDRDGIILDEDDTIRYSKILIESELIDGKKYIAFADDSEIIVHS